MDEDGKYLVSAPIYNVVEKEQTIPLDVPFKPWLRRNWPGGHMAPIPAQASSEETFEIALSMLTCPVSMRVSMVHLRYDDNTEFKYVSPTLRTPPTPNQAMQLRDKEAAQRWSPLSVTGTLQIDAEGRAQVLEIDAADVVKKWLQKEFSRWKFVPAWVDGKPALTQLPFLFLNGETTHDWTQIEAMKRKGARGVILVWPQFFT